MKTKLIEQVIGCFTVFQLITIQGSPIRVMYEMGVHNTEALAEEWIRGNPKGIYVISNLVKYYHNEQEEK